MNIQEILAKNPKEITSFSPTELKISEMIEFSSHQLKEIRIMNNFLQQLVNCLSCMDRNFDTMNESITLQRELIKLMDKQIKKVEKAVKKGDKKDAVEDIKKLKKMDKKQDAKVEKCDKEMNRAKTAKLPKHFRKGRE